MQKLAIEIYQVSVGLPPEIMNEKFQIYSQINIEMRKNETVATRPVNSIYKERHAFFLYFFKYLRKHLGVIYLVRTQNIPKN